MFAAMKLRYWDSSGLRCLLSFWGLDCNRENCSWSGMVDAAKVSKACLIFEASFKVPLEMWPSLQLTCNSDQQFGTVPPPLPC